MRECRGGAWLGTGSFLSFGQRDEGMEREILKSESEISAL